MRGLSHSPPFEPELAGWNSYTRFRRPYSPLFRKYHRPPSEFVLETDKKGPTTIRLRPLFNIFEFPPSGSFLDSKKNFHQLSFIVQWPPSSQDGRPSFRDPYDGPSIFPDSLIFVWLYFKSFETFWLLDKCGQKFFSYFFLIFQNWTLSARFPLRLKWGKKFKRVKIQLCIIVICTLRQIIST